MQRYAPAELFDWLQRILCICTFVVCTYFGSRALLHALEYDAIGNAARIYPIQLECNSRGAPNKPRGQSL